MKILLHTCCSCCALGAIEILKNRGLEVHCYFYNPNIHPSSEYFARLESMKRFAQENSVPIYVGDYELNKYFETLDGDFINRCANCYTLRLEAAIRFASSHDFDGISTTLLTSIYQNHELIKNIGEKLASGKGLSFIYFDNRDDFRINQQRYKKLDMYRQKYCGCIFSEKERYKKKLDRSVLLGLGG